jgi:hypothetical protein
VNIDMTNPADLDFDQIRDHLKEIREDVDALNTLADDAQRAATPPIVRPTNPFDPPQTPAGRAGGVHAWHALTRREAAGAWTTLTTWVDWLTDRYQLTDTLPGCWYRHGALIEELDALRAAWTNAYLTAKPPSAEAATWHQHLARTLARIHGWDRYGCASGTHRDDLPLPTDEPGRAARDAYLSADIHTHTDPPAPPPDDPDEPSVSASGDSSEDLAAI